MNKYKSELEKAEKKKTLYNKQIQEVESKIRPIVSNLGQTKIDKNRLDIEVQKLRDDIQAKQSSIRSLEEQLNALNIDTFKDKRSKLIEQREMLMRKISDAYRQSQDNIKALEAKLADLKLRREKLTEQLTRLSRALREFAGQREHLLRDLNRLISDCKAKFDLLEEFPKEFEVGHDDDRTSRRWSARATYRWTR